MRQFALYLFASAAFLGGAAGSHPNPPTPAKPDAVAARPTPRPAAPANPTQPGQPALWANAGDTSGQCRQTCAQTYYFCQANASGDDCSGNASQCQATCAAPGLRAGLPY